MRSRLPLSLGTLALLLALGCSSRGGEDLFTEDTAHDGVDEDAVGDAGDGDSGEGGPGKSDAGSESSDAGGDADAGPSDASDEEDAGDVVSELPPAEIVCGSASCTTPEAYCCRPTGNNSWGPAPACKAEGEECKLGGFGNVGSAAGTPQYCSSHDQCAGGQCCAIRKNAKDNRYSEVKCQPYCEGAEVEVCDPANPDCSEGTCKKSTLARDLYVCQK